MMSQPIQRNGVWWTKDDDGRWLQWDAAARTWVAASAPPPPPPAPPSPVAPQQARNDERAASLEGEAPRAGLHRNTADRSTVAARGAGAFGSAREVNKPLLALLGVALLGLVALGAAQLLNDDGPQDVAPVTTTSVDGGGTGEPGVGGARAAFIRKGDARCATALDRQRALPAPESQEQLLDYLTTVRSINHKLLVDLKSLPRPRADRKALVRMFGFFERAVGGLDRAIVAARRRDPVQVQAILGDVGRLGRRFNALATRYGFRECNKDE